MFLTKKQNNAAIKHLMLTQNEQTVCSTSGACSNVFQYMPPHQCCLLSATKSWLHFIVKLCICVLFTLLQVLNLEHGAEQ